MSISEKQPNGVEDPNQSEVGGVGSQQADWMRAQAGKLLSGQSGKITEDEDLSTFRAISPGYVHGGSEGPDERLVRLSGKTVGSDEEATRARQAEIDIINRKLAEAAELETIKAIRQEILGNVRLLFGRVKSDGSEITRDERSQAAKTLTRGGVVVDNFIRPEEEMVDPSKEQLTARRKMVLASMIALNNGRVTEEQKKILEIIGIGNFSGVEVVRNEDQNRFDQNRQERRREHVQQQRQEQVHLNEVFTEEQYSKVVAYALECIFDPINPVRFADLSGRLNVFWAALNGDSMNNGGYRIPLELSNRLNNEFHLSSWAEVASVMAGWKELKGNDVTTAMIRDNLFFTDQTEKLFGTMNDVLFVGSNDGLVYDCVDPNADVSMMIGSAMKDIYKHFGELVKKGRLDANDDYWPLVGSPELRLSLYNELKINKFIGEAAFAYLLSNLILPEVGVGANPFDSLVHPIDKKMAAYGISASFDASTRLLVQEEMADGMIPYTAEIDDTEKEASKKRIRTKLMVMFPSRLIPILSGGSENIDILLRGDWPKWRSETMTNSVERIQKERARVDPNIVLNPASDRETKMQLLRTALNVDLAYKEISKSDSGVEKLLQFKKALIDHALKLKASGYLKHLDGDNYVFGEGLGVCDENGILIEDSPMGWVSSIMLSATELFLFTHSVADHLNSNPMKMDEMISLIENTLLKRDAQSGKYDYIGIEGTVDGAANDKVMREYFITFMDRLWGRSFKIIDIAATFGSLPKWYGSVKSEKLVSYSKDQFSKKNAWGMLKLRLALRNMIGR